MNSNTNREIAQILKPLMQSEQSRQALVYAALSNESVVEQIDFSGATHDFVISLVNKLDAYGTISTGELALVALLNAAKERVGFDKQQQIDLLISQLRQKSPSKQPMSERKPVVSPNGCLTHPIWTVIGSVAAVVAIIISLPQFRGNEASPTPVPPSAIPTLTWTPEPTNILEPMAINTSAPITTAIPIATNIPIQPTVAASSGFPCEGQIVFTSGALLNQVRVLPSTNSPARPPVQQGATVTLTASQQNEGNLWYQIEYANSFGWILASYIGETNC